MVYNKNFDNYISSTYQQKDNIWKMKLVKRKIGDYPSNNHKIQTNNSQKPRNFWSIKSSNLDRLNLKLTQLENGQIV